jgi:hypothetical protein
MANPIPKEWVVVKFKKGHKCGTCGESASAGKIKIWPNFPGDIWDSPTYRVLGYADSFKEAKKIRKGGVEV